MNAVNTKFGVAEEVAIGGSFFKFKEVGEYVTGILVDSYQAPARTNEQTGEKFAPQTIVVLDTDGFEKECVVRVGEAFKVGGTIRVAIPTSNPVVEGLARKADPMDKITLTFVEETEAKEGNEHGFYRISLKVAKPLQ